MNTGRIFLVLLFAALGGCATPKLRHAEFGTPVSDTSVLTKADIARLSGVSYYATGNLLRIDDHRGDGDPATQDFMGASLPVATGSEIYVAYPKARAWGLTRTYLGATYTPNTRILSNLGVLVKDDRKQFVTALGSVLASFVTAAPVPITEGRPTPPEPNLKPLFPFVRDSAADLSCKPFTDCRAEKRAEFSVEFSCLATRTGDSDVETKKACGNVTYGTLPKDAVARASYLDAVKDKWTDTFPVPACRSAKLVLCGWTEPASADNARNGVVKPTSVGNVILETVVSDPNYVRIVKLPPAGRISSHPACGADVLVGDDVATDPVWAAIAELGAQTKAIKDARNTSEGAARRTEKATDTCSAATRPGE